MSVNFVPPLPRRARIITRGGEFARHMPQPTVWSGLGFDCLKARARVDLSLHWSHWCFLCESSATPRAYAIALSLRAIEPCRPQLRPSPNQATAPNLPGFSSTKRNPPVRSSVLCKLQPSVTYFAAVRDLRRRRSPSLVSFSSPNPDTGVIAISRSNPCSLLPQRHQGGSAPFVCRPVRAPSSSTTPASLSPPAKLVSRDLLVSIFFASRVDSKPHLFPSWAL
jgi:hypothetical protein